MRLEDHDRGRCRPEYELAILEDLEWLGLEPQLGQWAGTSQCRQSDRTSFYQAALQRLGSDYLVYGCTCSRKDLAGRTEEAEGEIHYPGRCRDRGVSPGPGRGIRLVISEGEERFNDGLLGPPEPGTGSAMR